MNYLYYDSGTTNTRLYLFKDSILIDSSNAHIGSKDSALYGNSQKLLQTLKSMMDNICEKHNLQQFEIDQVWLSGMISSPTGIVEIPHLTVPVDLTVLRENIAEYYEPYYFKRTLYIIPGVKTKCPGAVSLDTIHYLNNMRGEETEIFGILHLHKELSKNCIMIMPGSHTQIAYIHNGAITNIISTITGELYSAIKSDTILSTSIPASISGNIDSEMLCKGYENLNIYGFNRALYTVRTLELFMPASAQQRHSYFEGILNGGVLNVIVNTNESKLFNNIAVYGSDESIEVFEILFKRYYPEYSFTGISSKQEVPFSANGFLSIKSCKTF